MRFGNIFWLVLSIFLWGFVHSLTASLQFKALIRRFYGPVSDRYYRLGYNVFSILSLLIVLIIAVFTPDRLLYVIPFPWIVLSILVEILAVSVILIGLWQTEPLEFLGIRQMMPVRRREASKLVTNGLYQFVRHPQYTAGLVFIWLFPLMTARLLVINLALSLYIIVGAIFEERKLKQKFGHEFTEYAAATPMFIPFLNRLKMPWIK